MVSSRLSKPKIVVVLGATASGKTALGAAIARRCGGEIVSADSRQVYRGLDLGTGKERLDIPQHLIDCADPGERYTVAKWQRAAERVIDRLGREKKLPVVVGGSSLYVAALVDNFHFPPEDPVLRAALERQTTATLYRRLTKIDPQRAARLEPHNRRYLVRALERAALTGATGGAKGEPRYESLLLGIELPRDELYRRIDARVEERLRDGMLEEVEGLLKQGVSATWLMSLGLEYRYLTRHLTGDLPDREEMERRLKTAIHGFARRQLVWWRRRSDIHWVRSVDEALKLVRRFLSPATL